MIFKKQHIQPSNLENAIDELFLEMRSVNGDSEEYSAMAKNLDTLYKLKEVDIKSIATNRVSKDALVNAAASIAGILLIVNYEKANVLTSKALSLLTKLR